MLGFLLKGIKYGVTAAKSVAKASYKNVKKAGTYFSDRITYRPDVAFFNRYKNYSNPDNGNNSIPDDVNDSKPSKDTVNDWSQDGRMEVCNSKNECHWYKPKSLLKNEDLSEQVSWMDIAMTILYIIAACLLILGVIKKKRMFMLPLVVVGIIYGISDIYHLIDNYSGRRTFEAIMDIVVTITAIFVFKDMSGKKRRTQPRS